jgi:integrase
VTADDWARITAARAEEVNDPTDTVGTALTAFRASVYWKGLAVGTQKTWGAALDRIEAKWGKAPLKALDDPRMKPKVVAWRNSMAATPRTADISVMVLSKLFEWAVLEGHMIHNPAHGVPTIYRPEGRAAVIWLPQDLEAIKAVAEQPLQDAIDLAVLTGLRRADLVALRWDEVGDLDIHRTAAKRSRRKRYTVSLPRLPELNKLLDALRERPRKPNVETVLVNSFGKSWTGDGLASSFHDARQRANDGAGIWHTERDPITGEEKRTPKRLHDLRGTFATRIMTQSEEILTNTEVAERMGWSPQQVDQIRKKYVDDRAIVRDLTRRLRRNV